MHGITDSSNTALACVIELAAASRELNRAASEFGRLMAPVQWAEGLSAGQLMPLKRRLEMIEQISDAVRELSRHGHRFRRAEARALYAEGMTMSELADIFGVTRQRVSMLLREREDDLPAASGDGPG